MNIGAKPNRINQVYRISWTFNKQDVFVQTDEEFSDFHVEIKSNLERLFPGASFIFSLERGLANGRLHYQGHIKLKTKLRPHEFALRCRDILPGIHASADSTIGSTQAEFYSFDRNKPGYISGPYMDKEFQLPYDGKDLIKEEQFYPWQNDVKRYMLGPIHPDKIFWVCQEAGGCGKSAFCKFMSFHYKYLKLQVAKASDLKNLVYKSKKSRVYMVDITRTISRQDSMDDLYCAIEDLKNGHVVNTKYETGECMFEKPHVVVFSNQMPDLSKLSAYKWEVYRVSNTRELVVVNLN